MREHKLKEVKGFAKRYGLDKLIYFEEFEDSYSAFERERQLKKWKRAWKLRIIEEENPTWMDLASNWE